jgi:hypothetical protein
VSAVAEAGSEAARGEEGEAPGGAAGETKMTRLDRHAIQREMRRTSVRNRPVYRSLPDFVECWRIG